MPTTRTLYSSSGLEIGIYDCPPGDRAWREENTVGDGYHVAIAGPPVLIAQARARPVVATANHAIFYNDHEVYRRGLLSDRGDHCVFIKTDSTILREITADTDPAMAGAQEFRFPFVDGPLDPHAHLSHRLLVEYLTRYAKPDRLFVEEAAGRVLDEIVGASIRAHRVTRRRPGRSTEAHRRALVEDAKALLSRRFAEALDLRDIATHVHSSPFHLARIFRERTGNSLHGYRNQLRLRASLDYLADPGRHIAGLALELGYTSHSHFTDSFRRTFGMSPSAYREAAARTPRTGFLIGSGIPQRGRTSMARGDGRGQAGRRSA